MLKPLLIALIIEYVVFAFSIALHYENITSVVVIMLFFTVSGLIGNLAFRSTMRI